MATKETTYDEAQIAEKLQALPGWYFEDGWIRRVYKTDGWPTTLMLVNAIGYLRRGGVSSSRSVGDVGPGHGEARRRTAPAASPTRTSSWRGRSRRSRCGGRPRAARCEAPRTSSCGAAIRADERRRTAPDARLTTARRVSFVTGTLAEPALRRVLAEMAPPFAYDVAVLKITRGGADDHRVDRRASSTCPPARTSC